METPMDLWKKEEVISEWIMLTLLFITCLIGFIIYTITWSLRQNYKNKLQQQRSDHQHRLQLQEATLITLEAERKRFAQEIHDSLIGKLTAIRYGLEMGLVGNTVDKMMEDCIGEARQLSHTLYPPMLKEATMEELIDQHVAPYKLGYNIQYFFRKYRLVNWGETHKLHIIRILQELLTNTIKHAGASAIYIKVRQDRNFYLSYCDNGRGMSETTSPNLGLQSIQDRILKLEGKVKYFKRATGFHILIMIPI